MSKEDLFLRKEDFSLDTLLAYDEEVRQELYEHSWIVVYLAREANILRDELLAYDEVVRKALYLYTCQIVGSQAPVLYRHGSTPFLAFLAEKLVERMAVSGDFTNSQLGNVQKVLQALRGKIVELEAVATQKSASFNTIPPHGANPFGAFNPSKPPSQEEESEEDQIAEEDTLTETGSNSMTNSQ